MSHLVHGNYQIDLFNDTQKMIRLHQAMDKVNNKYDDFLIERASGFVEEQAAQRRTHRNAPVDRVLEGRALKGNHKNIHSSFHG